MNDKNIVGDIFSRKMSELFDLRVENNREILDGLSELSTYLDVNSLERRRNLRSLVEERSLAINRDFLMFFKNIFHEIDKINKNISYMNSTLVDMKSSLASTKYKTKTLIEATLVIKKEINDITIREDIITTLIDKFQLTPLEILALKGPDMTSEIFSIIERTECIIEQCKHILQSEKNNLIQEVLEQMTMYQDAGREKLFRWTRGKCSMHEATVLNPLLPRGLAKLRKNSDLFDQIIEELSANRGIILVRQFIDALTMGEKPIELRVVEPRRYVGDMLAWLHQAIPSELEYLSFVFRCCDASDEIVSQTLNKITERICHPFRVRVEHVLLGEENSQDSALLQDLYVLINDYNIIISQMISNSRLNSTLMELGQMAEKMLLHSLQNKVSAILGSEPETESSTSLFPREATKTVLALLMDLSSANSSSQMNEAHLLQVVSCVVDPLVDRITERASKLPAADMAIYLLNNFHLIETSLALFPFLDDRLERLKAQCDAQVDTLTSEQASALVGHLGLGPVYPCLQGNSPKKPLSKHPAMDVYKLNGIFAKLKKFVASPHSCQLPQLAFLSSAVHKVAVQKNSLAVIASIYEKLYEVVHDPENEFVNPGEILPETPESMNKKLLNAR